MSRNDLSVAGAFGVGAAGCALVILISFLTALVSGWILMLVLGALHNSVNEAIPALGYWVSVLIAFAIRFIGGLLFGGLRTSSS